MAFPAYEKLFLLEVLVDTVYISKSSLKLDQATVSSLKETCVMFQFLEHPPLIVCEEDFYKEPSGPNDTQLNFKSGKSCVFSMPSTLIPSLPYKFDVNVSVIRRSERLMDKVVLGTAAISLGDSFSALVHSSVDEPDLPLQKTKAGTFDVFDPSGGKIGYITAFVRLSCFGQLIVTQFQVGANQDDFMFRGTEPKQVVEIPGDSGKAPKMQVDPNYVAPTKPEQPGAQYTQPEAGYGDRWGATGYEPEAYGGVTPDYYQQPPPPQEPEGNYKEIVAEIRGHSLHIRVPMREKKDKDVKCKKQLVEEMEGPVCKYAPPLNLCECDFPVPPEAIPRCGPL